MTAPAHAAHMMGMSKQSDPQPRNLDGRFGAVNHPEAPVAIAKSPTMTPDEFDPYIWEKTLRANGAEKSEFPISGVKDYWEVSFNAEHDMSMFFVRTDDGQVFVVNDYLIHDDRILDESGNRTVVLRTDERHLKRRREVTREGIDYLFYDLDENGATATRDERCTEILDYIAADMGIELSD